jgi:hypothetical protein
MKMKTLQESADEPADYPRPKLQAIPTPKDDTSKQRDIYRFTQSTDLGNRFEKISPYLSEDEHEEALYTSDSKMIEHNSKGWPQTFKLSTIKELQAKKIGIAINKNSQNVNEPYLKADINYIKNKIERDRKEKLFIVPGVAQDKFVNELDEEDYELKICQETNQKSKLQDDEEESYVWNEYQPNTISSSLSRSQTKDNNTVSQGEINDIEDKQVGFREKSERIQEILKSIVLDENFNHEESLKHSFQQSHLTISPCEAQNRFQNIIYYKVSGSFLKPNDVSDSSIYRRYNDFKTLNTLLEHQFYYKVLPYLPEKNLMYKIKANKGMIERRSEGLQIYLNKLLLIPEILNFDPLLKFLLDQEGFMSLDKQEEISQILKSDNIFYSASKTIVSLWKTISQKTDSEDFGFYSPYAKEIDSLYIFIKNMFENYQRLQTSMNKLFKQMKQLSDISLVVRPNRALDTFSNSETMAASILVLQNKAKRNILANLILVFERLHSDVMACRNGIIRKDKIYTEHQNILHSFDSSEKLEENLKRVEESRLKIEKLERCFKPELSMQIRLIKSNLELIFGEGIEKLFVDIFEFE